MKRIHKSTTKKAVALTLALGVLLGVLICLPVHGEQKIYDAVIRLHVLAHSDSEEDQALKMQVRDAVLELASGALEGCRDRDQAQQRLQQMLPALTEAAEKTLRQAGSDQEVRVTLTRESYPTRNYESFCFPAGEYLSLRVMLGQAQGQNFWCVLFPPLCMSAATVDREEAEEEFIAVGLNRDQYSVITQTENGKYKLRFKILELLFGR